MPQSMTGFARCERNFGNFRFVWSLKSVNHRFLDLAVRLPDGCESLERLVVGQLKACFLRGHLDCTLAVIADGDTGQRMELNEAMLTALFEVEQRILAYPEGVDRSRLTLSRLLSWPGLLQENRPTVQLDVGEGREVVLALLAETVAELAQVRQTEGQALVEGMNRLLERLQAAVDQIAKRMPRWREQMENRLRERVAVYSATLVHDERLAQELIYLFNRSDIAEELERLGVHLREMGFLLTGEAPVGRRLEFLCQELNREANTLCVKAQDSEISSLGVDIKVNVEQLREQAQNLE